MDFGDSSTQVARGARGSSATRALLMGGVKVQNHQHQLLLIFSRCHLWVMA